METNFEKIQKLISESSVSEPDQVVFIESCRGVVDENLELLVELFTVSPKWIEISVENFKEKRDAAYERNMKRWKDIIESEVSVLEDMSNLDKLRSSQIA
jgi:hypothetical protein